MNAKRLLVPGTVLLAATAVAIPAVASPAFDSGARSAGTTTVQVRDDYFAPSALKVSKGTVVRFVWKGKRAHNVAVRKKILISNRTRGSGSRLISGPVTYNCTLHKGMNLRVNVR